MTVAGAVPALASAMEWGGQAAAVEMAKRIRIEKDPELNWREFAILLLETAAEIEHSLLVQYLYAAYSLRRSVPIPECGQQKVTTDDWQRWIVEIAQEEMGHLVSVQNLLRSVGGPLNFERERFPYRSQLYPFPFMLEPLTKNSLAKYVATEMPESVDPAILPPDELNEIWDRATRDTQGVNINHVGLLYETLIDVFRSHLTVGDFSHEAVDWQAVKTEWPPSNDDDNESGIKVLPIILDPLNPNLTLKDRAIRALRIIARQGEGITACNSGMLRSIDLDNSHFMRFLTIYRQFPACASAKGFDPTYPVPTNPNASLTPAFAPADVEGISLELKQKAGRITNETTLLWAHLFNVRYHILLAVLEHVLSLKTTGNDASIRDVLRRWAIPIMKQLRAIAKERLVTLPQSNFPGYAAGAPFELPATTSKLPDREQDRWKLHLDLLDVSECLMSQIDPCNSDPIIQDILRFEEKDAGQTSPNGRRRYITNHLKSLTSPMPRSVSMPAITLNSFADVQRMFNSFVSDNNIQIADRAHRDFWNGSYDAFVNGNVPIINQTVKILVKGDPNNSNIVTILRGPLTLPNGDTIDRMPEGGPYMSGDMIDALADWIRRGCPESATHSMRGIRIPDWNEIKSYFTDVDVQHMLAVTRGSLNLHECASVLRNAEAIFKQVSTGKMPPGNPWGAEKINGFFAWWKSNPTCPSSSLATRTSDAAASSIDNLKTSNWFAWNNIQPPGPPSFHIIGEVQVPNPGIDVLLTKRSPQGINPQVILLDLHLMQRPGLWPQHVAIKQAHFEEWRARYSEADVLIGGSIIAHVPVVDIS